MMIAIETYIGAKKTLAWSFACVALLAVLQAATTVASLALLILNWYSTGGWDGKII